MEAAGGRTRQIFEIMGLCVPRADPAEREYGPEATHVTFCSA